MRITSRLSTIFTDMKVSRRNVGSGMMSIITTTITPTATSTSLRRRMNALPRTDCKSAMLASRRPAGHLVHLFQHDHHRLVELLGDRVSNLHLRVQGASKRTIFDNRDARLTGDLPDTERHIVLSLRDYRRSLHRQSVVLHRNGEVSRVGDHDVCVRNVLDHRTTEHLVHPLAHPPLDQRVTLESSTLFLHFL